MSNQFFHPYTKNLSIFLFFLLINLSLTEDKENNLGQSHILYPSVLSLQNKGFVVVQADGIHFYDANKVEEESKKIKFETPIKSEKENEKISISQFPEKEGGYIIILIMEKIYLFQSSGYILKEENLSELTFVENIKLIPYKEEENNILYIISYKTSSKNFGINYYKFDLINKKISLISTKVSNIFKNPAQIIDSHNDILGTNCLFMKNPIQNEEVFTCFLGITFPAEILVKTFDLKNDLFEEKNNYNYFIGKYENGKFNLITAISNKEKNASIIYYYLNKILYKIDFNFIKGLSQPRTVKHIIDLTDDFWKKESDIVHQTKESIFSSRLYWAYCKSYMLFFNSNFTLVNKGFISHDNNCANLLSYSNFFKENKFSLMVDNINNDKILITKKRKLEPSRSVITVPEKCNQILNIGYDDESISFNLCLECDNANGYYRVYDPNKTIYDNGKGFVQCFNETTKKNFYLDKSDDTTSGKTDKTKWVYKPCYETCETCSEEGNAYNHKCETCALRYKFFDDSGNKLCEAQCSYAYYYTYPLNYYECTETYSCPVEAPYLVVDLRKCVRSCQDEPVHNWSYAGNCYSNCVSANAEIENSTLQTCKDKTGVDAPRCVVTYTSINSNDFITSEGIKSNAETYAKAFANTLTHINYYNNSDAILIIYKDETCIEELKLSVPKIDLDDTCEEKVKQNLTAKYGSSFNEKNDMIIALVGGESTSSHIKSSYSFFYKDGSYINISDICQDVSVSVVKQVDLEQVDDEAEEIAGQGIDIFDADSPFYTDVCFMYDSPNGKDATPNDRLNKYFPNITLCETGCTPNGMNLTSFEVNCKCEFSDIMSSTGVGEKLIEDSFGEIFEMIDNSNVVIFKCIKDVFVAKHFFKNVGTYIALGVTIAQIVCVVLYYLLGYNPMLRYLYYLQEYQCSAIEMKNNNKGGKDNNKTKDNILTAKLQKAKAPPKKEENPALKTPAQDKLILDEDKKQPKKLDINSNDLIANSDNKLAQKKVEKNEKDNLKKGNKNEKKPMYADKLKEDYDIEMDEYLKTDFDDMEFEDALKYDTRSFGEYFWDRFKEQQIIMDTFFNHESLKPMTVKIIIFLLNIILYFVINGLFYSEEYVSNLFNSEEEEHFFSFFPRSLSRFLYCTIVGVIIGIIVDFVAFDEKKVKRLFLREKKNTLQIRFEISVMTKDIKRNYLILIIICFVIDLIALYYVNCFNNVYPNLTGEWIKSSICIMLIMQILTVLVGLLEALIRLIAFKLKSERIYKIKDLFD